MFGDGFDQATILRTGTDGAGAGDCAQLVERARVSILVEPCKLSLS